MTPVEAAKAVAILQAAFPGARWTEPTALLYEQLLADLEFELAHSAITRLVCTTKFLPTIAEIREAAADIVLGPCRHPIDAWGDVVVALEWAQRSGISTRPKFNDPIVDECVKALGWRDLSNEAADRSRFADLYSHLQRAQRVIDLAEPGRLRPGASEAPRLPPRVRAVELPPRPELAREDPNALRGPELAALLDTLVDSIGVSRRPEASAPVTLRLGDM